MLMVRDLLTVTDTVGTFTRSLSQTRADGVWAEAALMKDAG
ncbi:hypothetical protein GALL_467110 [mine drainage metagenome]|uniref:Uncharacterized protein n=1 Tax=mine drainage metagenome TaxID=410659 RepID=A0A1J5Q6V3_9ZZZZ